MIIWLKETQRLFDQNNWSAAARYLKSQGLELLPALIDSHVHFRTPGEPRKEDWRTGSRAALNGGISAVIDMPNNQPAIVDLKTLKEKIRQIKKQLCAKGASPPAVGHGAYGGKFPIKYFFYLGAQAEKSPDRKAIKNVVGLKIYLGSTTGNLLVNNQQHLEKIFKTWPGLLVFHAEAEDLIKQRTKKYSYLKSAGKHSIIRNWQVATQAIKQVIKLAKKYQHPVYLCHVSASQEIKLIKKAKKQGVKIFVEVSPHHLFLNQSAYKKLGNFVKVNPPLRTKKDNQALWQAVKDGTIDVMATDHAPHLPQEKRQPYKKAPAGLPEIDTFLPLMLTAVNQKKLSLSRLIELVHKNPIKIFKLKGLEKCGVIVNLNLVKKVQRKNLQTKCGWSAYEGMKLQGWPVATILDNKIYLINNRAD